MTLRMTLAVTLLVAVVAGPELVRAADRLISQSVPSSYDQRTKDLLKFLNDNGYKRLRGALLDTGLADLLNTAIDAEAGGLTIFAPRDDAFKTFMDLYNADRLGNFTEDALRATLLQHVVEGLIGGRLTVEAPPARRRLLGSFDSGFEPNLFEAPAGAGVLTILTSSLEGLPLVKLTQPFQRPIFVGPISAGGRVLFSAEVVKPDHFFRDYAIVHGIDTYFVNPCPLQNVCDFGGPVR